MTVSSGGEAIVSGLVAHGVDTVFGLPGAQIYGLFDAFQQAQLKVIGARHEQDHFHVEQGRAAQWIRSAALHVAVRIHEVLQVLVPRKKIEVAPDQLLDVVLEHRNDQFVLAVEIRVERPARESGRRHDRFDAGGVDALFLEHARRSLEQLVAGGVPRRSGANS